MLHSDSVWRYSETVRGTTTEYGCAEFVAADGLGTASCSESWATGTDDSGTSVTAYDACEVSCPETSPARSCTTLPACTDDSVWRYSETVRGATTEYSCAEFVAADGLGAASCSESWATGADADGASVTAYVACEASCPEASPARSCAAPAGSPPPPSGSSTRTCADTDANGVADDAFDCSAETNDINAAAEGVTCGADPCTAEECCTVAPQRTCANIEAAGSDGSPLAWDCTEQVNSAHPDQASVSCPGDACTAALCCTVPPDNIRTCADTDMDGTPDDFDCSSSVNSLTASAGSVACAADPCLESECCTVGPPRTCADINADGTADDTFDCAAAVNAINAAPADVTCAGDPCEASECCTVVPARTCADTLQVGTSEAPTTFDCSGVPQFIAENAAELTCAADPCTTDECCTADEPPPRTCGDTDADGVADSFDCAADVNFINEPAADVECAAEECTALECCTVAPPLTCDDTTVVGTSAPHVQFNCSSQLQSLSATPAEVVCEGLYCTSAECCTVPMELPPTPVGKATLTGSLTLDADLATVTSEANLARFRADFKAGIAATYSDRTIQNVNNQSQCATVAGTWQSYGSRCRVVVTEDDVTITSIEAGSVIVGFAVVVEPSQIIDISASGGVSGGSVTIGDYEVLDWGLLTVTADSCPDTDCNGVVYGVNPNPDCDCIPAMHKLLCRSACSRPRRTRCANGGFADASAGESCPPPPPPPERDYTAMYTTGWVVIIFLASCTFCAKLRESRKASQKTTVVPEEPEDYVHKMLMKKANDKAAEVLPETAHRALTQTVNVGGAVAAVGADSLVAVTDGALKVGGVAAGGALAVGKAAGKQLAPVALAGLNAADKTVDVAGRAAVAGAKAGVAGAAAVGGGVLAAGQGAANFALAATKKKNVSRFGSNMLGKLRRKKATEAEAEPEPEPEPEPEADPEAGGMEVELGSKGPQPEPEPEPEPEEQGTRASLARPTSARTRSRPQAQPAEAAAFDDGEFELSGGEDEEEEAFDLSDDGGGDLWGDGGEDFGAVEGALAGLDSQRGGGGGRLAPLQGGGRKE